MSETGLVSQNYWWQWMTSHSKMQLPAARYRTNSISNSRLIAEFVPRSTHALVQIPEAMKSLRGFAYCLESTRVDGMGQRPRHSRGPIAPLPNLENVLRNAVRHDRSAV